MKAAPEKPGGGLRHFRVRGRVEERHMRTQRKQKTVRGGSRAMSTKEGP